MMEILEECNQKSLLRLVGAVLILLYVCVTLYLVIRGITWMHYETFTYGALSGGVSTIVGNKFINSKYNTGMGQMGKPMMYGQNMMNGYSPMMGGYNHIPPMMPPMNMMPPQNTRPAASTNSVKPKG